MLDAIRLQARSCGALGSPLYERILTSLALDWEAGGAARTLLPASWARPVHDAAPLRLLAAVHRIVLLGRAPALARFYPSAGGDDPGDPWPAFVEVLRRERAELAPAMSEQVQTNEIARSAVLAGGFVEVAGRTGLPLALLEVGASGGLNLRWDRYAYDTGNGVGGDAASAVRFTGVWEGPAPELARAVEVVERRGCDLAPIDAASPAGALRLRSFVWPDQLERLARLGAALAIAAAVPVTIDQADAGSWVPARLAAARPGVATIVYHSIVVQYLPPASREAMRRAIVSAGDGAGPTSPIAWLRMEPAGPLADLRLDLWPGGGRPREEAVLAECGYHGDPIRWRAGPLATTGPVATS